ncbi:MAG: hypothetical protein JNK53_02830 [Phycisphaerae bacterium]|nr:hypothetical protein [Phycisphaerae bacterium]
MQMSFRTIPALCIAASFVAVAGTASAGFSTAQYAGSNGLENMGAFTASVTYDYTSGPVAALSVTLTNTTSLSFGGYITALALQGANGSTVSAMTSSSSAAFNALSGPVSVSPFGDFQAGASTSGSWTGGGAPQSGLGIGASATFTFNVTGSAGVLSSMTAATALSPSNGAGLAVRFRGMDNGGSDKVLAYFVPGPSALAGLALVAAGGRRRRR